MDGLLDQTMIPDAPAEPGEFAATLSGRQCKKILDDGTVCPNFLPEGSPPARKFCDEHYVGKGRSAERQRKGNNGERAPKLVLDVGGKRATGGAKDQRARDTAKGAEAFLKVVATGLAVADDNVCAAAVAGGAEQWGTAVGELSKYQPWLSAVFAPVGGDNQMGAWLGFLIATGAIALPVLAHHNLLPESVGARFGGVMVAANDIDTQQTAQPAA
jgi:hypothetical protein